MQSLKSTAIW